MLLSKLTADDVACLQPFERAQLARDQVLVDPHTPIASVFFLESGIASVHEVLRDGSRVGVGIIGFEGMTGWSVLLGCDRSPHEAIIAIGGGGALSIPTERLLRACSDRPGLNALFLRYVQYFMSQMARTITSNLRDPIERRLARWLLMNHDRLGGDEIHLTHDQLGVMLGVRRASVTDTLHILEGERLIRSTRGVIVISDRPGLEAFAGETYGVAEAEYVRVIGPFAGLGAVH
ncbi:MAG: Crp/Fnr family transcriptional regulator [Sphingomicrobium sp.]